jgi:hypothetical protein
VSSKGLSSLVSPPRRAPLYLRDGRRGRRVRYRTLLGHFRHEVGHYYWDRLVRDAGNLDTARAMFGDYRQDYAQALTAYYANGAPSDWQAQFVTPYAAAHPWEDFAETWAHYLHIVDTLGPGLLECRSIRASTRRGALPRKWILIRMLPVILTSWLIFGFR